MIGHVNRINCNDITWIGGDLTFRWQAMNKERLGSCGHSQVQVQAGFELRKRIQNDFETNIAKIFAMLLGI